MAIKKATKKTRRPISEEKKAELRARDTAIVAAADAAIARHDAGDRAAAVILAGGYRRMATYSLHNQMSLMEQAAELSMPMADVDTFRGWMERGRVVRKGERAKLYISRPVGTETVKRDNSRDSDHDNERSERSERVMFRMSPRFELSQTDALDDLEAVEAGKTFEADATPAAAAWFERLTRDAEHIGYRIATADADSDAVHVDDEHKVLTVPADISDTSTDAERARVQLSALAQAIAGRLSNAKRDRKAQKKDEEEPTPVLQMS